MDILEVYPKDWHVRIEMSFTQLLKLLDFLDNCEFTGDLTYDKHVAAKEYVIGDFFPKLDQLSDDIMKRGG